MIDTQIVSVLILQLCLAIFMGLYSAIWYEINRQNLEYLKIPQNGKELDNFIFNFVVRTGNSFIMLAYFVPISLVVTTELVKLL